MPELSLVPPMEEQAPLVAPALPESLLADAEPLQPIEMADPIESVNVVSDELPVREIDEVVEEPIEIHEPVAAAPESEVVPESDSEPLPIREVTAFEPAPMVEAAPTTEEVPVLEAAVPDAMPVPEAVAVPEATPEAPVVEAPVFEQTELEAPAVPTVQEAPETEQPASESISPFEATSRPVEVPTAPTRIFGSDMAVAETATPAQQSDPAQESDEEDDGWVSFHSDETPAVAPSPFQVPDGQAASEDIAAAPSTNYDLSTDPQWDLGALEATETPSVYLGATQVATDPVDMATEVERTLEEMDTFAGLEEPEAPMEIASFEPPQIQPAELHVVPDPVDDDEEAYASDDDLPLPDFTGVYAEELEDPDGVPNPVEARSAGVSARRAELDKLRPADEELSGEELAELEERKRSLSVTTQILLVAVFGLAVLVLVWLFEPDAVNAIRNGIQNLFG